MIMKKKPKPVPPPTVLSLALERLVAATAEVDALAHTGKHELLQVLHVAQRDVEAAIECIEVHPPMSFHLIRLEPEISSDMSHALDTLEREGLETFRLDLAPAKPASLLCEIDERSTMLAHIAFVSVVALGQRLRPDGVDSPSSMLLDAANATAIEACGDAVEAVLDALAPYVSLDDNRLRRMLLDDEPVDEVPADVARAN
jgi:hypothetical protein